jgi:uncharacterized membrane protein
MALLALVVAAYAVLLLVIPVARADFVRDRFATLPVGVRAHLLGGAFALVLGPFQFSSSLRSRFLNVHRWMGRVYVVAVLVGGSGGIALAPISMGGVPAHLGFAVLGVLWIISVAIGYRRIRGGDLTTHRQWMMRNYSLTFAAVTLRVYLPLALAAGVPFESAYPVIAWLCWVPNLLFAEWLIARRPSATLSAPLAA